jgi:hypothetical protein
MGRGLVVALGLACGGAGVPTSLPPSGDEALVVDRLEGEWAVVQSLSGERATVLPRALFPPGTREGSVLWAGQLRPEAERQLREQVSKLRQRLLGQPAAPPRDGTEALTTGGERWR